MKFIKLTDKKNRKILINFDKVGQIMIQGKYSRVVMDGTLGIVYFDVIESLDDIAIKLEE